MKSKSCMSIDFHKHIAREVIAIFVAIFAILSVLATVSNALLLVSLVRTKQVKSPTILIVFLCISDLLLGILGIPSYISKLIHIISYSDCSVYWISEFNFSFLTLLSPYLTVALAIDRYSHMQPNAGQRTRLQKMFKRPYLYVTMSVIILLCLLSPTVYLTARYHNVDIGYFGFFAALLCAGIFLCVTVLYVRGYLRIRRFVDDSPLYQDNDGIVARPQYVRSLFKTVLVLTSVMFITYLPVTVGNTMLFTNLVMNLKDGLSSREIFIQIAIMIYFLNPFLNSLIVLNYNVEAKTWLKSFFSCLCIRREREGEAQAV